MIFTVVMTFVLSYTKNTAIQVYGNLSVNVLLQTVGVFILIKSIYSERERNINKKSLVYFISKHSLGVYAIHVAFITRYYNNSLNLWFNDLAIVNVPIVFVSAFIISLLISFVFSKIPLLKKVV